MAAAPCKAKGRAVGARVAVGKVRRVTDAHQLHAFKPGEVLVSDTTSPDWEPVMKTAAAIVTNRGGRTCHAAIVARELGIPAVVGTEHATEALRNGDTVTVSCAEGAVGKVYDGEVKFHKQVTDVSGLKRPATEIMVNLGNPELAFQTSLLPCDGVGLARMEFIVNEHIKVHPMAVLASRAHRRRRRAHASAGAVEWLRRRRELLRREARRGRGHHRRGVLSAAGDRAAVGLQEQRVRGAARWA